MSELELKTERFHEDEGILSPQKEEPYVPDRAYIEKICREVCQSILQRNPGFVQPATRPSSEEEAAECEPEENLDFVTDVLNSFRKQT